MKSGMLLVAAALTLLVSGCGGGGSSSTTAAAPQSPSTSPTSQPPKPKPSRDPYAPNTGKYALKVGQTRVGDEIRSTLLAVKRPMVSSNPYQTPDQPGEEFMGANVRTCVDKKAHRDPVVWSEWIAAAKNGNEYPGASSSWDDFPLPEYPPYRVLTAGECVSGWLLIPVQKGAKISKVLFAPGGQTVAEWRL